MSALKPSFIAILVLATTLLFTSCSLPGTQTVRANGPITTKDYNMTDFTSVDAGSAFSVEIVPSATFGVTVTSNESMFDYIEITRSGSTLRMNLKSGVSIVGPLTLDAKVSMPEIWGLTLSGASKATVNGFSTTHDFSLDLSGASRADFDIQTGTFMCDVSGAGRGQGSLAAGDSNIRLSGAAYLELEGSAGNATMDVSGASNASLSSFFLQDTSVTLSGASHASIMVNGKLDVDVSGGSRLDYSGDPAMGKVNVTGGSSLNKR